MVHVYRKKALNIHISQSIASVYTLFQNVVSQTRQIIAESIVSFIVLPVVAPKGLINSDRLHPYYLFTTSPDYVLRNRTSEAVIHYNMVNFSRGPCDTVSNKPVVIILGSHSADVYVEGNLHRFGPCEEIFIENCQLFSRWVLHDAGEHVTYFCLIHYVW